MRFAVIKAGGQYGALREHADQLAAALLAMGHKVEILDLTSDGIARLARADLPPMSAFLSFAGLGADLRLTDGGYVFDQFDAPFVQLHVDHPVHARVRLTVPLARSAAFFLDWSHVRFMEAWRPGGSLGQIGFLPPGASALPEALDDSDGGFAQRDLPLIFTGTYRGAPQRPWRGRGLGNLESLLDQLADRMAADATLPVLGGLQAVLEQIGRPLTPELLEGFVPVLGDIQSFSEAYHRDRIFRILGEAGTVMHVWGNGWTPLTERYRSFVYGGEGHVQETLRLLRRARLVLNINNGFVEGGHERVFAAMAAGAAVITDTNPFYDKAFEGEELARFDANRPDALPEQLARLADSEALSRRARAGRRKALQAHTWRSRAEALIAALSPEL